MEPQPKRKKDGSGGAHKKQPTLPVFIESELGITIDNWVAIVYNGVFDGRCVRVSAPEEMSALHSMGDFGKGSLSRSRPSIMRRDTPHFLRMRQYRERAKWADQPTVEVKTEPQSDATAELWRAIRKVDETLDEASRAIGSKIIYLSDESSPSDENETSKRKKSPTETRTSSKKKKSSTEGTKSLNSAVVLPDSDSEDDDYFSNLNPRLYNDASGLKEYLALGLQEAYFLAFGLGCLRISDEEGNSMNLLQSWKKFNEAEDDFAVRYVAYHYYRSRGWVVKPGVKFGGQFLLYKEGQSFYHATYIVLVEAVEEANRDSKLDWNDLLGILRTAGTSAKEVLIAQVCIPADSPLSKLKEDPGCLSEYAVHEIWPRRWRSNRERNEDEE